MRSNVHIFQRNNIQRAKVLITLWEHCNVQEWSPFYSTSSSLEAAAVAALVALLSFKRFDGRNLSVVGMPLPQNSNCVLGAPWNWLCHLFTLLCSFLFSSSSWLGVPKVSIIIKVGTGNTWSLVWKGSQLNKLKYLTKI